MRNIQACRKRQLMTMISRQVDKNNMLIPVLYLNKLFGRPIRGAVIDEYHLESAI